mgnify:CR=1 FL=1
MSRGTLSALADLARPGIGIVAVNLNVLFGAGECDLIILQRG